MKSSIELLSKIQARALNGSDAFSWRSVSCDSRSLESGDVFFAIPGEKHDGLRFVADALGRGASAIVIDSKSAERAQTLDGSIPLFVVNDIREALAVAAAYDAGAPSASMRVIGVTGTNGKTSTAWLISQLLRALGEDSLLCGTLGIGESRVGREEVEFRTTDNTSVDPVSLQHALRSAKEKGISTAVLEVTSQGIAQKRCVGVDFDLGVFTNLTRDHLDIHNSMEEYAGLKYRLFSDLLMASSKRQRVSLCNVDDPYGLSFHRQISESLAIERQCASSFSDPNATYYASRSECSLEGIECDVNVQGEGCYTLKSSLLGSYNLCNMLTAFAALHSLGFEAEALCDAFPQVQTVPGRLERVSCNGVQSFVFVDYAHTPDALDSVLRSLSSLGASRLTCVFGCGGDRDNGKRPLMAQAVATLADKAIVTSDNPRTENPEEIVAEILKGFDGFSVKSGFEWTAECDRRKAIFKAIEESIENEVIVVAGKGHEDYQEIHGVKHPFLDRLVCEEALQARGTR